MRKKYEKNDFGCSLIFFKVNGEHLVPDP